MFLDSLDIANRALQHCGQPQILSITEDTKANVEATFAYDKLRRVELQRNIWSFATRKVCLRAVDTTTMVLQPALYSAATTYMPGAIVSDANGQIWLSMAENNIGNTPGGNNEIWDMYFGPLTIEPWNQAITAGPEPWSPTTYYSAGNEVTGSNGNVYLGVTNNNVNNNPVTDTGANWTNTGILNPYNPLIGYWAGELVYVQTPNSPTAYPLYQIYMSLTNNNTDTPNIATPWNSTVIYSGDQCVSYSGQQWYSLLELNLNNTPTQAPAVWQAATAYSNTNTVAGSDGFIYTANGNTTGNDPTTDGGVHWVNSNTLAAWSATPTVTVADINWLPLQATMGKFRLSYPLGTGPSSDNQTKNIFRLPAGHLKECPQDPKAGANTFLSCPSGEMYEDWNFDGNFIVSMDTGPILYRFIADIIKVRDLHDMFCEGLACRIAMGILLTMTQSTAKKQDVQNEYKVIMGEARIVNAIETGPVEPPEDNYITCRA